MPHHFDWAIDTFGNALNGATVTVYLAGTTTPATLFSDAALSAAKANPVTADITGYYSFFVAPGQYKLKIERAGFTTVDVDDVQIGGTFRDVRQFGARGDGATDDTAAIQAALDLGGAYLPAGIYLISSTLTLGNATSSMQSTIVAPYLIGEGSGASGPSAPVVGTSRTRILWGGAVGGLMVKLNGPVHGARVEHLCLDGGDLASSGLREVRANQAHVENVLITRWANGYAHEVDNGDAADFGAVGGAGSNNNSVHIGVMAEGHSGTSAHGLRVGRGVNINEVAFYRCGYDRSNHDDAVGLELGCCDHVFFHGCFFSRRGATTGKGVVIRPRGLPQSLNDSDRQWPKNVTLTDTPIIGGFYLDESLATYIHAAQPAVIVSPLYLYDGQQLPPVGALSTTLHPYLVGGVTDMGDRLGVHRPVHLMADSAAVVDTTTNTTFNKSLTLTGGALKLAGTVCRLEFGGVYGATAAPTITISVTVGGVTYAAFRMNVESGTIADRSWSGVLEFIVATVGAPGTARIQRSLCSMGSFVPGSGHAVASYVNPAAKNLQTGVDVAVNVLAAWSAASASNTITLKHLSASFGLARTVS
jgi:hypothetical protein